MRVLLSISGSWEVTCTPWRTGEVLASPRQLIKVGGLPAAPAAEWPAEGPVRALLDAAGASTMLAKLLGKNADPGMLVTFGQYLFLTLIGKDLWAELVKRAARVGPGEPIDISISAAGGEAVMCALPWELMHTPEPGGEFLVASASPRVSLTRHTGNDAEAAAGTEPERPQIRMRVLFVVGTSSDESAIHPGAEYLGLLRQLGDGPPLGSQLLLGATRSQVADAVKRFRPSIVHFICHGDWRRLELQPEQRVLPDGTLAGPDPCDAASLKLILQGENGELPAIVVLNACDANGQPLPPLLTKDAVPGAAPLAVALVQEGIPMVLGMAGRVSDDAARMFTRGFYASLLASGPPAAPVPGATAAPIDREEVDVAAAAAAGRRVAMEGRNYPRDRIDWALPCLVVRRGLEPVVAVRELSMAYTRERSASDFRFKTPTWHRLELFSTFGNWLRADEQRRPPVFAVVASPSAKTPSQEDDRLGLTTVLREMSYQAVHEGYIPCALLIEEKHTHEPPLSALDLARMVIGASFRARQTFGLPMAPPSVVLSIVSAKGGKPPDLTPELSQLWDVSRNPLDSGAVIGTALRADLSKLAEDARLRGWKVLVVLDDVHRYDRALAEFKAMLALDGFGTREHPVPVIIGCNEKAGSPQYDEALRQLFASGSVRKELLGPMSPSPLAYLHYLLTRNRPLVLSATGLPKQDGLMGVMFRNIDGIPSRLAKSERVEVAIEMAAVSGYLTEADDEKLLRAIVALKAVPRTVQGGGP